MFYSRISGKFKKQKNIYRFARWSRWPLASWGPDEGPVVDGAALRALGPDGGGVLGDLGRDDASAELQDLLITQTRTLQDRKTLHHCDKTAHPLTSLKIRFKTSGKVV